MASLKDTLTGTGVALVTPFKKNFDIDYDAFKRMIDYVIEGNVEYIVVLGTTGEAPTLNTAEKKDIIKFSYDVVKNRVPVVVGIGGNNTAELVHDLETFPLEESIAVLSASPYYSKPSQEGIYQHYKAIAAASPIPVLLYNVPSRTARNVDAHTILRLAQLPNIAGIKEAGGDMAQCALVLRDRPSDFLVVSGDDALAFPQIATGMHGVISVAANSFPAVFSSMVRATLAGDLKKAKKLNDSLLDAYHLLFVENNPAGVKAALSELGLIHNYLRLPLVPLSNQYAEKLRAYTKNLIHLTAETMLN